MTREELKALNDRLADINSINDEIEWLERCAEEIETREPRYILYWLETKGHYALEDECLEKIKAIALEWMKVKKERLIVKLQNTKL